MSIKYISYFQVLYDYVDCITDEHRIELLEGIEELHRLRRENKHEQRFWNQFWYRWDYVKLKDAAQQAFNDMITDENVKVSWQYAVYKGANFEKAVVSDLYRFHKSWFYLYDFRF